MNTEYGRRANTRNQSLISHELVKAFEKIKECKHYKNLCEKLKRLDADSKKTEKSKKKKSDDQQCEDEKQHSYMLKLGFSEIDENINSYTPDDLKNYLSSFFQNLLKEVPENLKAKIAEDCDKISKIAEDVTKEFNHNSPERGSAKRRNPKSIDFNVKGVSVEKKLKVDQQEEIAGAKNEVEASKFDEINNNQFDLEDNNPEIKNSTSPPFNNIEEVVTKANSLEVLSVSESPNDKYQEEPLKKVNFREKKENVAKKDIHLTNEVKPANASKGKKNAGAKKQKNDVGNSLKSKEDEDFIKNLNLMQSVHSKLNNLTKDKIQLLIKKINEFSLENNIKEDKVSKRILVNLITATDYSNANLLLKEINK